MPHELRSNGGFRDIHTYALDHLGSIKSPPSPRFVTVQIFLHCIFYPISGILGVGFLSFLLDLNY
jgi:hypothetical protein